MTSPRLPVLKPVDSVEALPTLKEHQKQIVKLLADGAGNVDIANRLYISTETVKNHRHLLFAKLGIHSITQLVKYAIAHGITTAESWR